jgi:RNA polymerase sigma-70 factor (ECF subfamily)
MIRAYEDAPDADLMVWSAEGDGKAFDEVVVRHGRFALRVAARLLPTGLAAEDIVQEAMMRAWTQAGSFDASKARLTTWLYRIVVNLCIDHKRRIRPEALPDGFDRADPAAGADEMLETREQNALLKRAMADLPLRQRAAMTLIYDEGLSGQDAAQVLGVSAKALERLLYRARASVRERLQQDWMETKTC